MPQELEYFSDVKDGKLQKNVANLIVNEIKRFEGKRVEIKIRKIKSTRSSQQNRLWWSYITIVAKEIGMGKDELHEIAKFKFLKKQVVDESTGEVFEYVGSTAKLNKTEFTEIIEAFRRWVAELFNIVLPDPGDNFTIPL